MEIKNKDNLWNIFGLSYGASKSELDEAYIKIRNSGQYDAGSLRLGWKILRDQFFSSAYGYYLDIGKIIEAGFFDDLVEPENFNVNIADPSWMTTPVHKIADNLRKKSSDDQVGSSFAVLISTGSFSPVHSAHIGMMEAAKNELEDKYGTRVLGGYLSPSHDGYVSTKYGGSATQNIGNRLRLCEEVAANSDWLMVDPWEGRYNPVPITFTDVISRLDIYLKNHFPGVKIDIYFVFGSDNAPFSRAFLSSGNCICVPRPGYFDHLNTISSDPVLSANPNIIISGRASAEADISSTSIRSGLSADMPSGAKDLFFRLNNSEENTESGKNIYVIRNDLEWATADWKCKISGGDSSAVSNFKNRFLRILEDSFKKDAGFGKRNIRGLVLNLEKQQKYVNDIEKKGKILNLDVCTDSRYKLNISRLFGLSDGQCRSDILIPRPYFSSLNEQIGMIPAGEYKLLDDDIATGSTTKRIIQSLPDRIKISEAITLLDISLKDLGIARNELLDVVDFRDFLVGSRDAGLVVSLPDGIIVRASYMLPYVSLSTRAKIPPSQELIFSIRLWKLNLDFFNSTPDKILLSDCSPSFRKLMSYIGFKSDVLVADICKWHIERLRGALADQDIY